MKKHIFILLILTLSLISCKKNDTTKTITKEVETEIKENLALKITPISHATAVISFNSETIYLDPTGGLKSFEKFKKPTYIIITDVHGDHFNLETLKELDLSETTIIAPEAVCKNLTSIISKKIIAIHNGEEKLMATFKIEAIPMYNLREEALKFHAKGRGNGYVFTINNERIYFSGDTEDIPEMRNLKSIDKAFICMNLPYTMTVESAADAVLEFKPKEIYPYHYRGTDGLSDVKKFKEIVQRQDANIKVIQ
ncbi:MULTISPECIES: MBL fold metallo-hydrolase [unclassified Polaribacter]|uniref:MBL fold metallo-hydrolase n=1 Tax=unclassified Polaribacter TaxID=196858 RepID=UPI0011BE0F5E|nr:MULTISPECIES: MBL fold metallo-hydrolase [unclassified Polaribacter]TXD54462.1 MBL fold metallo-hydrolase [Polaribacter sp. IC063]TXD60375.1 MBL fold metallo-hydrolase [Polaribacter sp. IC066]